MSNKPSMALQGSPPDRSWSNWFGNQRCEPRRIEFPTSEVDVQEAVARAARDGLSVRVAGGGHSLTPVVSTDGVLLDLSDVGRDVRSHASTLSAEVPAGLKLREIFDPLWEAGLALKNMGELETGTLAGAVSTGAHGTGVMLQCTSATMTAARIVTASGEILEVSREVDAELLRAAQVSLGMLGVLTEITIDVIPAYDLHERGLFMSVGETLERWDELVAGHRHFSFYYLATANAARVFSHLLPSVPNGASDVCYATLIDAVDPGAPARDAGEHERRDRMNRILAVEFDPNYREIEYSVPLEVGKETFLELRERLLGRYPHYAYPVNVRFVAEDDAFLSSFHGGPKVVFSISEDPQAGWEPLLHELEGLFESKDGLPHWGKEHALTRPRAGRLFPALGRFREIRRELDPSGVFLNDHLSELFA